MKKIVFLFAISFAFIACNSDDDNTPANVDLVLNFTQNWDGTNVSSGDIDATVFTNEMGHELKIARIRYLLSRITLTHTDGTVYNVSDYNLIDLSIASTFTYDTGMQIPEGSYTVSFVHGFNEADNITAEYNDLNTVSWNWPDMLGGGYHFLQFDGMYDVNTASPMPFNYHNGTARVNPGEFEQNFVNIAPANTINISGNGVVEIQMNIAEWFKNPYTWDLDVYNTPLMPNYEAQKLMQQNAASVYSVTIPLIP